MDKRTPYIVPSILVVKLHTDATILAGSNEISGDGSGGIDITIKPGEDGDGEDAGDAF